MNNTSIIFGILLITSPIISAVLGSPAFNNTQSEIIVSLASPDFEATTNIIVPGDYFSWNATMSITGMASEWNSSAYPENVSVYLNNTMIWAFQKTGFGPLGMQTAFINGQKNVTLQFNSSGGSKQQMIRMPKNAIINNATMSLAGKSSIEAKELANICGTAPGDRFGVSCSNAGDVNNDGYDDVIIGAENNDTGGDNAGSASLFYGGKNMDNIVDVKFIGAAANNAFGHSISGAGDLNGDGFDDIIIGEPYNNVSGNLTGRAYIYYGGPAMDNISDVILNGGNASDMFGWSVSGAGDVNGDGYDDIIVGANGNDSIAHDAGTAYIFYGGKNMDNIPDVIFTGSVQDNGLGRYVSKAGDLNNDGYDDILISAPYEGIGGEVYIYFGAQHMNTTPDITLRSAIPGECFGMGISGTGDVNSDGYDDFIIGAPWINEGKAYLYLGGHNISNIPYLIFTGSTAGDFFGEFVSTAGDVNQDGYDDVIIGASYNDIGGKDAGQVYLYLGGSKMDNNVDIIITGSAAGDRFSIVSDAGDVNADGFPDVVIGSYTSNTYGNIAGKAQIFIFDDYIHPGIRDLNIIIGSNIIWNKSEYFNGSTNLTDFAQILDDYLRNVISTNSDDFGNSYFDVPIMFTTKSGGNLTISNLTIKYQYNATTLNFAHTLNDYIINHKREQDINGNISVPIRISSKTAGRIKLFNLNCSHDLPPVLEKKIETTILDEDTANLQLIDLYSYFHKDNEANTALNFSLVSATNSSLVKLWIPDNRYLSADAETGDANDNWTGTVDAVVSCEDRWGQRAESNKFTIVVRNVNDPPLITSTPNQSIMAGIPYYYNVTAADGDNDTLQFKLLKAPPNMTIDSKTGKIQWIPRGKGYFDVNIEASDGNESAHQNFFLLLANVAPRITSTPVISASTGMPYVYNVKAEDANGDDLSFSLNSQIPGMVIKETTGQIAWTPTDIGNYDVSVRVSDGKLRAEQNFTINVVQGDLIPRFVSTAVTTATAGYPYEYAAKAIDDDDDALTFSLITAPEGMTVDSATGTISWTPTSAGQFQVSLKVSDGKGGEALQEFTILVKERVKPDIEFTMPSEGQKVKGLLEITGMVVKGATNQTIVQVKVDSGDWMNATGAPGWQYTLDTTKLENGAHTIQVRTFDGLFYSEIVERNITVSNPKAPGNEVVSQNNAFMPVAGAIVMFLVVIGLAFGATEPGKYGFFAFTAPLYTRIKKGETLDHDIRYRIMGYLTDNPGEHYSALKKALNLENGGMVYHLLVLERDGFIKSQRDGILKRFYPATVRAPETRNRTPEELEQEMLQAIAERPGTTQRELVDRLVVSDKVVGNHLRTLVRESRITSQKNGKTRVYFPPMRT